MKLTVAGYLTMLVGEYKTWNLKSSEFSKLLECEAHG